ncbi:MAG TPA: hypothetical protein PKO36_05010 [Candidatus Hydrogenedentes bacterium]|nr:hypothetical protein [Candidatus Hydrogenedentota bacterium]HOV75453.1 hypothetical protein [Candidatus Hydrogenedentota bacterium]HPC17892.1 hypothetical protein [Candidatus Hydrogenedentota bacterium]HRT21249.1 hypothetical protein [Candidatus Hydrogenedentota bacterium]HRT65111.1 hypothetical protein [Candidatus Hydrogenedentota bacterium]
MDKKGIVAYLLITLILSFAIQLLVLKVPKASLSHLLLFAIPAFAAWAAGRISPASETAPGILWPVPFVRALRISCAIYLCFAVVFTIGAIAGFAKPDWSIGELLMRLPAYNDIRVPEHVKPMLPMAFLLLSFAIMFVIAPTVYAVLLLGVAYGWCGYLLPRLMPLGRWIAYGLAGLAAGISILPLSLRGGADAAHAFQLLAYAIAVSAMVGEVWRRSGHLGLTAVCAGCVYCHATQLWNALFPANATVFPWGGTTGILFALAWAIVALAPDEVFGPLEPSRTPSAIPINQTDAAG